MDDEGYIHIVPSGTIATKKQAFAALAAERLPAKRGSNRHRFISMATPLWSRDVAMPTIQKSPMW
jgi:hypothetical protein